MESIFGVSVAVNVFLAVVLVFLILRLRPASLLPPRFWTFRRGRWGVVELMGHVRFGAFLTPERLPGGWALRCEIPGLAEDEGGVQFVLPNGATYRILLCSEEAAVAVSEHQVKEWRSGWRTSGLVPFAAKIEVDEPELPLEDSHEVGRDYCVKCERPVELCECVDDDAPASGDARRSRDPMEDVPF